MSAAKARPTNGVPRAAPAPAELPVLKVDRGGASKRTRTILSVDGGGMRGVIPARVLQELEAVIQEVIRARWTDLGGSAVNTTTGERITSATAPEHFEVDLADYFDLMSGTSTGSILATYFASKGMLVSADLLQPGMRRGSAEAALNVFRRQGTTIFPRQAVDEEQLRSAFSAFLQDLLGEDKGGLPDELLVEEAALVFSKVSKHLNDDLREKIMAFLRVKYPKDGVEQVLQKVFSTGKLSKDLYTSLLVTSYDMETSGALLFAYIHDKDKTQTRSGCIHFDRDNKEDDQKAVNSPMDISTLQRRVVSGNKSQLGMEPGDSDFWLWEVVRASTAAPTYFPPAEVTALSGSRKFTLVDGGVVANNPEACALAFAIHVASLKQHKDLRLKDIAVLSVGCGSSGQSRKVDPQSGQLGWLKDAGLVTLLMEGGNDLITGIINMLNIAPGLEMGPKQLLRLQATKFNAPNDPESVVLGRMDDPGDFEALLGIGTDIAQKRRGDLRTFVEKYVFNL